MTPLAHSIDEAVEKLRSLPPDRVVEVVDFIEFLAQRERDRSLTAAAASVSERSLERIWDNEDDAEYDRL